MKNADIVNVINGLLEIIGRSTLTGAPFGQGFAVVQSAHALIRDLNNHVVLPEVEKLPATEPSAPQE